MTVAGAQGFSPERAGEERHLGTSRRRRRSQRASQQWTACMMTVIGELGELFSRLASMLAHQ